MLLDDALELLDRWPAYGMINAVPLALHDDQPLGRGHETIDPKVVRSSSHGGMTVSLKEGHHVAFKDHWVHALEHRE